MDRTDDRQLIRRLQVGDEEAVRELSDRYGHRIFQMALRHMKNREDAEEVTQDVLMKVYRKIDKFRGDAALSSWIYRITFNTAMSRLRTHRAARAAEVERDRMVALRTEDPAETPTPRQPADWSRMPDEELLEAAASRGDRGRAIRVCRRSTVRPSCCETSKACRRKRRARGCG